MSRALDSNASLLVAALDLQLVRLLRGAIRAADVSSGRGAGAVGTGPVAVIEPRHRHHPDPVIEPRPRIHPAPRFEPRPVVHPTPRIEAALNDAARGAPAAPEASPPRPHGSPIQPPWKVLPWECPPPPRALIKVNIRRTDIAHKGSLIDLFM